MLSPMLSTAALLHQSLLFARSAGLSFPLAPCPDRGSKLFCDQFATALANRKTAKRWLGKAQLFKSVAHGNRKERRIATVHPQKPLPFVCRQIVSFNHPHVPFEVRENQHEAERKAEMVASTNAGVPADFAEPVGTGGGPVAQDSTEIEFSQ